MENNQYPIISIVTPCLNSEALLKDTIDSLLNQNYPNLEYIVVDGGSEDRTIEILEGYGDSISTIINAPGEGLYQSLNKGFSSATGEVMGWLNSDDLLHPGALFTLAEVFSTLSDVHWVTGIAVNADSKGRCFESAHRSRWDLPTLLDPASGSIQQESTYWRRSLWEASGSGLDTTYNYAGDFELWCRFFQYQQLASLRAYIGAFRRHGKNLSYQKKVEYENEVEEIIQSYRAKTGISKPNRFYNFRKPKVDAIFYNFEEKRFKLRKIPLNDPIYE